MKTQYRVKVTIIHVGGRFEHAGNALTFDSFNDADRYGFNLVTRWTMPDGYIIEDNASGEWAMCATRSRRNVAAE